MNTMQVTCGNCAGIGYKFRHKLIIDNIPGTLKREEITCESCNGKGYTEYAVFSVEEAKAILKHCGLSTES